MRSRVRRTWLAIGAIVVSAPFLFYGLNITSDVSVEVSRPDTVGFDYGLVKAWRTERGWPVHIYPLVEPQSFSVLVEAGAASRASRIVARQGTREVGRECGPEIATCELDLKPIWRNFDEPVRVEIMAQGRGGVEKHDVELTFRKTTDWSLGFIDAMTF
jgi:hypothetical protein